MIWRARSDLAGHASSMPIRINRLMGFKLSSWDPRPMLNLAKWRMRAAQALSRSQPPSSSGPRRVLGQPLARSAAIEEPAWVQSAEPPLTTGASRCAGGEPVIVKKVCRETGFSVAEKKKPGSAGLYVRNVSARAGQGSCPCGHPQAALTPERKLETSRLRSLEWRDSS